MKPNIHPKYHAKAKISCACGNELTVGSTEEEIKVELCSLCHPFFTGTQKLVDSARRVEKFNDKVARQAAAGENRKGKKAKAESRAAKKAVAKQ